MDRLPLITFIFLGFVLFAVGAVNRWVPEAVGSPAIEQVQSRL